MIYIHQCSHIIHALFNKASPKLTYHEWKPINFNLFSVHLHTFSKKDTIKSSQATLHISNVLAATKWTKSGDEQTLQILQIFTNILQESSVLLLNFISNQSNIYTAAYK